MPRYDDTFVGSLSGAVEPTRSRRRVGADDRRLRLGDYEKPHGTLYTGRAVVRSAIVEAFKALPDVNYQPVRMLRDQEDL